jgi:hypothetical protein
MNLAAIEPGNRIQLPAEWMRALGLHGLVALERTGDGILVRPCPRVTWEDIFATKLTIGSAPPDQDEDVVEVTGDDFLF